MTISTEPTPLSYDGDDTTVDFPISWNYFAKSHVVATLRNTSGVEAVWVLDTDYTLTDAGLGSGTLTATTAPATGETIVIDLDPPNTQDKSLPVGGNIPTEQIEAGLDLAAQRDAKLESVLDRTMRVPTSDVNVGSALELPIDSARQGKYFLWGPSGEPGVGDSIVTNATSSYSSIYNLLFSAPETEGIEFAVEGFYADVVGGGGRFFYDASKAKSEANGVTIFDSEALNGWTGSRSNIETTFHDATSGQGTSTGTGCFIRIYETISVLDAGAVGDSADSYRAFLAAGSVGEVVFVPAPAVDYELSAVPAGEFRSDESITLTGAGSSLVIGRRMTTSDFIGQDKTITIGTDYATLALAKAYLDTVRLMPGVTVTVVLTDESLSSTSIFDHPDGSRIKYIGATPVTTTASAAGAASGSAGAWSIQITVSSTTGMTTGDYAIIRNAAGTGSYDVYNGSYSITVDDATHITVVNTNQESSFPTATLTSADIICVTTTITYTGVSGFEVYGAVKLIDQVAIIGNSTNSTVGLLTCRRGQEKQGHGSINVGDNVCIAKFDTGVNAQYGCSVDWQYLSVSTCKTYCALAQHGGSIFADNGIVSGQTSTGPSSSGSGIGATNSGDISFSSGISVGNKGAGIWAYAGGSVLASSAKVISGLGDGIKASYGGSIRCASANVQQVNGKGIIAEDGGTIYAASATSQNNDYGFYCDGGTLVATNSTGDNNTTKDYSCTGNGTLKMSNSACASGTIFAQRLGYISAITVTGSPTYSPTVNTFGNENGYIDT